MRSQGGDTVGEAATYDASISYQVLVQVLTALLWMQLFANVFRKSILTTYVQWLIPPMWEKFLASGFGFTPL